MKTKVSLFSGLAIAAFASLVSCQQYTIVFLLFQPKTTSPRPLRPVRLASGAGAWYNNRKAAIVLCYPPVCSRPLGGGERMGGDPF